ncbi:MAG: DNA-binding protein [Planctomycetes bacterium]|nr:DNA-binding protein [Planctomycetota bacterium]
MKITLELTEDQAERLQSVATRLAVRPDELARAAFADLLAYPAEDFEKAASYVLRKNRELYERLR